MSISTRQDGATHTPGPWMAAAKPSSVVGLPIVATPSGRSIASVTFFKLGEQFAQHDQESQANARLISAAPDMLAALKEIVAMLRNEAPGTPLNNHRFDQLGIQAYAAIAKAEGR